MQQPCLSKVLAVAAAGEAAVAVLFLLAEPVAAVVMVAWLTLPTTVKYSRPPGIVPMVFLPRVSVVAVVAAVAAAEPFLSAAMEAPVVMAARLLLPAIMVQSQHPANIRTQFLPRVLVAAAAPALAVVVLFLWVVMVAEVVRQIMFMSQTQVS